MPVFEVRVTEPEQKVVAPLGVMVAAGKELTVTVVGVLVALHPLALVTVTE